MINISTSSAGHIVPDCNRYLICCAVVVAATLPVVVLFPFFQDKSEKGVIAGEIKG